MAGPSVESLGELGDRTISKVKRRVLPLIVLLYFVAYLDRNNVGFAKLTMSEDIGLSAAAYGLGAGMFFIGYALLEIPSNAGMYRFGARKWIARILITWGIFATAMATGERGRPLFTSSASSSARPRPASSRHHLVPDLWFPAPQRVAVLGIFILAQPVSNALGAPVSGLLLQMEGIVGLHGWQWLYIIEGIPAMLWPGGAEGKHGLPQRRDVADRRGTQMEAEQDGRRGREPARCARRGRDLRAAFDE